MGDSMKFEPLSMYCGCGMPASAFTQIGLTHDHQLVFHWWCADCDEPVYRFKSLSECWRDCPPREDPSASEPSGGSSIESEDLVFLATMGIRLS